KKIRRLLRVRFCLCRGIVQAGVKQLRVDLVLEFVDVVFQAFDFQMFNLVVIARPRPEKYGNRAAGYTDGIQCRVRQPIEHGDTVYPPYSAHKQRLDEVFGGNDAEEQQKGDNDMGNTTTR